MAKHLSAGCSLQVFPAISMVVSCTPAAIRTPVSLRVHLFLQQQQIGLSALQKNFFFRPADRSACLYLTHSALGVIPPPPSPPPPSLTLSVVAVRQPADPPDARSPCSVHIQHLRLLDHPVTVIMYPNHHTRPSLPRLLRASHSTALSHGG